VQIKDGNDGIGWVCNGATGAGGPSGPSGPSGTAGQTSTTSFGNASLTTMSNQNLFINNTSLTQTVTVPANVAVLIQATGAMQTNATAVGGFSVIEFGLYINDVLQSGTRRRVTATNATPVERGVAYWSMGQVFSLAPGNYTIRVAAFQPQLGTPDTNASAVVSGVANSVLQPTLSVTFLRTGN
jgi:hypothetical protein